MATALELRRPSRFILIPAMFLLAICAPETSRAKPSPTAADPDLIAAYRGLGLPTPPADTPLVKEVFGTGQDAIEELAFLLRPGTDHSRPLLLVGTQVTDGSSKVRAVDPKHLDIAHVRPEWFGVNAGLATAIQCRERGWNELADALQQKSLSTQVGWRTPDFQPANLPPERALHYLAWAHWMQEISRPDIDRAPIAKRLEALLQAEPELKTQYHLAAMKSLELALRPRTARPRSIEALVDALVDIPNPRSLADPPDARYIAVAMRGFEGMPVLIAHLDDERMTRSIRPGMNNIPSQQKTVANVVSELVADLAGDDCKGLVDDRAWPMYRLDKAKALAWWERARVDGEERYFVGRVIPQDASNRFPYAMILRNIVAKYPNRLPEIFLTVLQKRPTVYIHPIVDAVANSTLPREQKLKLILLAADDADLEHRRAAFWQLKKLDEKAFIEHLINTLNGLPKAPTEPYWSCREGSFANLVMETNDPRVWQALVRAARRADVWLRLEYLNPMDYDYIGARQRRERLAFLAQFLDDTEVRQAPLPREQLHDDMHSGPFAAMNIERIEVRQFAAMQITSILDKTGEVPSVPAWNSEQWKAFRERVSDAINK